MADGIVVTPLPVRATAAGTVQPLSQAIKVQDYDLGDIVCSILSLIGGGAVQISLITGMQTDSEDGWVEWITFTSQTTAPIPEKKRGEGPLKFIRWKVTALSGSSPVVVFYIDGLMRRLA